MQALFQTFLYIPIFNAFVALYNLLPDVGVVIIIITALIKLMMYPLTKSSIAAQKSISEIQPKLEELKKKHKDNQQLLAQETMRLYKENKVNPLGSCLPILIQLPIFIAIYWVLREGLTGNNFDALYSFVKNPGHIKTVSLGFVDLGKSGNIVLAVLSAGAQYWQAKMMQSKRPPKEAGAGGKDEDMASIMNKQMLYFMPFLTLIIGFQFPGGLALYWFVSTLLTGLQQKLMFAKKNNEQPIISG